jgi:methylated-DNA-protein-cysteine methyltransferase related protein
MTDDFFDKVFRVVRLIPEGRVTTYGHIARFLGTGRSARIVGYAMNASHNDRTVPAHRVVNRVGLLTGKHFFDGTTLMRDLLESEGIVVLEDKIQEFSSKVWDPMEHLNQDSFFESSTP